MKQNPATLLRRFNDNGALLAIAYGLALYGLLGRFHFSVNREFWERLMDGAHIPLFFALAVVTVSSPFIPRRARSPWRTISIALFLGAFAGVMEALQPHFGRTESMADFLNGIFGAVIGLAGVELWRKPTRGGHLVYLAIVMMGITISLRPAYSEFRGIVWRRVHFPELASFESPWEMLAWHPTDGAEIERSRLNATAGNWSLHVILHHGTYPGVEFLPGELDWRKFAVVEFDAYNPGPPFPLILRLDDDGPIKEVSDRAHRTVTLETGRNHITIPLNDLEHAPKNRLLNLEAIRRLVFFVEARGEQNEMFLDSIHLSEIGSPH